MKRKSILTLIAVLALAVSIPLFALAESDLGVQPQDGTGFTNGRAITDEDIAALQLNGLTFGNGYGIDEDGYCYALDENGVQQRLYSLGANGQYMALRMSNNTLCWANDDLTVNGFQTRRVSDDYTWGGRGCPRWN